MGATLIDGARRGGGAAARTVREVHDEIRRRQREGDLDGAVRLLRRLIAATPDNDRLRADLVVLLRLAGETFAADRLAVELDPTDDAAWARLSRRARQTLDVDLFVEASIGWAAACPDDPMIGHFAEAARSIRDGDDHARASEGYVRRVFDGYADRFDDHLSSLGYRGPEVVAGLVADLVSDGQLPFDATIADLGCGTGLVGVHLRDEPMADTTTSSGTGWNGQLIGVDLAPKMVARSADRHAAGRPVYDEVAEADFVDFLDRHPCRLGAVVAADAFIYVGDLRPVLDAASRALRPGGWLVATLERSIDGRADERGYASSLSGRFVHDDDWVRGAAAAAGFEVIVVDELSVRRERHQPVPGSVVVARTATG